MASLAPSGSFSEKGGGGGANIVGDAWVSGTMMGGFGNYQTGFSVGEKRDKKEEKKASKGEDKKKKKKSKAEEDQEFLMKYVRIFIALYIVVDYYRV